MYGTLPRSSPPRALPSPRRSRRSRPVGHRGRAREVLAFSRAAEDDVQWIPSERGEAAPGRRDVRRLRVVDVAHAADLGDELEPVRHAREGLQRLRDRLVGDPGGACGSGRCCRVLAVVAAGQARLGRQRVVCGELDARRRSPAPGSKPRGSTAVSPGAGSRRCAASRRGRRSNVRAGRGGPARG